jgi:hypothetical protein
MVRWAGPLRAARRPGRRRCVHCRRGGPRHQILDHRRVAGIRYSDKLAGYPSPTDDERVKAVVRGARRTLGTAPAKKAAATSDKVLAMVAVKGGDLAGKRDRALMLLGFALAARRSELVALDETRLLK